MITINYLKLNYITIKMNIIRKNQIKTKNSKLSVQTVIYI